MRCEKMRSVVQVSKEHRGHKINPRSIGIFFEDINFSCDGGINANVINNYSFDGVYFSAETQERVEDSLRYWEISGGTIESKSNHGLHENSKYAAIRTTAGAVLINRGYNGGKSHKDKDAISIEIEERYLFEAAVDVSGFAGSVTVSVENKEGDTLTNVALPDVPTDGGFHWISAELNGKKEDYGHLCISFQGEGEVLLDRVSLMNADFWGKDDAKWRHGKLRRDMVQALADLKPAFMRFPGGCIVEGSIPGNEYNWKDTVGSLYERKGNFSLWSEKVKDGGYHQSYQIGFYEYFCLCEDLGMKPLPTLSVGLNCQLRSFQRGEEKCSNIPIDTDEFQTYILQNYLDLIEFANGNPATNKWAKLRADMGHPTPFGLERIGVGNENYGEEYFKRFAVIEKEIHERYPDMLCIMCGGTHPNEESVLGITGLKEIYKKGKKYKNVYVDEHSYHSPKWFEEQHNRYDDYDRNGCHVYVGEYAANGSLAQLEQFIEQYGEETVKAILTGKIQLPKEAGAMDEKAKKAAFDMGMRPMNLSNMLDTALGEAAFLIGAERNGDVVEMASYAPLFNLVDCDIWNHNLINFNPKTVCLSTNYYVQQMFSLYRGNKTLDFIGELPESVYLSVTEDEKNIYIKTVNTKEKCHEIMLKIDGVCQGRQILMSSENPYVRNELSFQGDITIQIAPQESKASVKNGELNMTILGYSVMVVVLDKA